MPLGFGVIEEGDRKRLPNCAVAKIKHPRLSHGSCIKPTRYEALLTKQIIFIFLASSILCS